MNIIKFQIVDTPFREHADQDIVMPQRGTAGSAGYDFFSPVALSFSPGESHFIWTDIKAIMNSNIFLQIVPRSSIGIKKGLVLKNLVGIIDSDYANNITNDGNIGIVLQNTSNEVQSIAKGERIVQGIFIKYKTISENDTKETRSSGFGSTDHRSRWA